MVSTPIAVIVVLVVLIGIGFYAFNTNQLQPITQRYIPSSLERTFSTGDKMVLNLLPLTNSPITSYSNNQNIITSQNTASALSSNKTLGNTTQPSVLGVSAEKLYPQEQLPILPTNTFQLGNPICVCGKIQMVVPNTCLNINGQVTCQYVDPPIFHFLISFTCNIAENNICAMEDHSTYGITDGAGNYNYTWIPRASLNPGLYLITIQATSQVKDQTGQAYILSQQELANLVR